jgi:hypothetical protein
MAYIAFTGEVLAEAAPARPALEELADRSSVIWLNGLNPVCSVIVVVKVHCRTAFSFQRLPYKLRASPLQTSGQDTHTEWHRPGRYPHSARTALQAIRLITFDIDDLLLSPTLVAV